MDYKLYLFCLIAFIIGRASKGFNIYIGPDAEKYENATIGIQTRSKQNG